MAESDESVPKRAVPLYARILIGVVLGIITGVTLRERAAVLSDAGMLVITLLKVFIHDLATIQNIFRIGALLGVAVIAFIASFLYQRFFDRSKPAP